MKKSNLLTALVMSSVLVACGGGDPKSASGKPDNLLPEGFVPTSSSSSSSSSSAAIVNQTIPYHENFDNAVDTLGFFSANYKGLNTDSSLPFYFSTGGFLDDDNNPSPTATSWITGDANRKLQLGNGRFSIGQTRLEAGTTTADTSIPTWGEFDLSRSYKVSFCVVQVSTPSASNFELYVDNNSTGGNNSRYGAGNASRILQVATHTLVPGTRHEVTVPGSSGVQIGTETSFFQFRVSSGGFAVIDDLVVEYVGESHGLSLPACVAETSLPPQPGMPPATPAAPTVIAGDQQISVVWETAGIGATYDILYNTVNSIVGAIPFEGNSIADTTAVITGLVNDTTYYVFIRAKNSVGTSEYSPSSSATPQVPPVVNPGAAILTENFGAADTATFFAAAYKSLPDDNSAPMYVATAGESRITLGGDALSMTNARFTIGDKGGATAAGVQPNGVFDLTQPYRVTFTITEAAGTGNFQFYVDNNTTGAGNSIHAALGSTASRLIQIAVADITSFPHQVVIETDVGTATSFFQLRADSNVSNITIRDLVVEYQAPPALLVEDFSAADTATFTSAAYKAIPSDASLPLYVPTAGGSRITFAEGALSMNNARFTIGDKGGATTADSQPNGDFDLSKPYRVRFTILAAAGTGNFQFYVDNNTTGAGNSIHAALGSTASRLVQIAVTDLTTFPHEVLIESDVGTPTSFFQLRADSSVSNITIDDLVIEYQ